MLNINNLIQNQVSLILKEQGSRELNNTPSDNDYIPFTPAEKKFLGKFDAYGTTHLGIIYSTSDIGIHEFISRSGIDLNVTQDILMDLSKRGIIKIVPYTGYASDDNYTIELQLSLDDVKGWGEEDQKAAEKKNNDTVANNDTVTPIEPASDTNIPDNEPVV